MKHPCRHCEERHIGCHATCEEYLAEVAKRKAQQEERMKSVAIRQYCFDSAGKKIRKMNSRQKG